jgi:nicotinate-nucleotide adenylyltransferase
MKIAIFGGSFDPVHKEHIRLAEAAIEELGLDKLFVMPACAPPHKPGKTLALDQDRLRMCELAFGELPKVEICDYEIAQGGTSYTYDTLKELQRPDARLFLLCGTDMVLTFDKWYRYEDIFKMCYPTYVRREDDPVITSRIVAKIGEYYEKHGVMFRRIITDPIKLSSTDIRRAVKEGRDISSMVPPAVEKFIRDNRLYLG